MTLQMIIDSLNDNLVSKFYSSIPKNKESSFVLNRTK